MADEQNDVLTLTTEIIAAFVANNSVRADDIPALIRSVRATLEESTTPVVEEAQPEQQKATGAQIKKSITPDALISFVDAKPYKTLKRHLARHGLTMDEYRGRYGLPSSYPSVAPNYSAQRSAMAKELGLGARGRQARTESTPADAGAAPTPAKRGRKPAQA